ncbi:S66 peptidase family protein [Gloeocapsopsis dulcis]|uniref:LD-carboxypeptidase n=1 Tax=Gloeocapsopsis dulcis AAB1 = 1H9 TaxID=1433147 RepID=A0A6N8FPM6_9CHRO|nr:LD-carboxypeptidase [Gloeocapsopsis dulcis]MUL35213.1 LD-carboxypeptidase [Gloeocapsopsis dulcis AAB1 = 1H9]WNN89098.1 LD-carboxypeptidase [Gloeocapsopsis dulcis]
MKTCQLPPPLKPGDLLRVIAPSGALREVEAFYQGVEIWRKRSYRVEISADIDNRWGYLAGKDRDRRTQLLNAWKDSECRGILCARGGYGSVRILEERSGDFIFNSALPPKWLIGFSDITALLWSLSTVGVSGIHAPVLTTLAKEPDWSIQRLFDLVESYKMTPLLGTGWGGGSASGILLPANLTVATHLLGTPIQPDLDGVILALEDVTEAPYRIDRLLTQWRLSGAFTKVRGIALGRFSRCEPPPNIPSLTIEEVLRDRLSDLGIPIVSNLPFGHDGANAALPVGVPVQLDGDNGILSFETPKFGSL